MFYLLRRVSGRIPLSVGIAHQLLIYSIPVFIVDRRKKCKKCCLLAQYIPPGTQIAALSILLYSCVYLNFQWKNIMTMTAAVISNRRLTSGRQRNKCSFEWDKNSRIVCVHPLQHMCTLLNHPRDHTKFGITKVFILGDNLCAHRE